MSFEVDNTIQEAAVNSDSNEMLMKLDAIILLLEILAEANIGSTIKNVGD